MSSEIKRQIFIEAAEGRTNRCISNIRLLRQLANPKKYQYTIGDIERIQQRVQEELDSMMHEFKASLLADNDFKL